MTVSSILFDIEVKFRVCFGLGPKRKFVNIYWKDTAQAWIIRSIIDVPGRTYVEADGEQKHLDCNVSKEILIDTILEAIENCRYSKEYSGAASLIGWKKFVEEHCLIIGEIRNSSLCFEPWVRRKKGHKNAHYVPCLTGEKFCAPRTDIYQAYLALCNAKRVAIRVEE